MSKHKQDTSVLNPNEELLNVGQAIIKSIPWIGTALDQMIFGRLAELRLQRIEKTLREIGEALGDSKNFVDSEEYANLLEVVLPKLARATGEAKRERFRSLLLNAAAQDPAGQEWAATSLAADLVAELDDPALFVLARLFVFDNSKDVDFVSLPSPQLVYSESFDWQSPDQLTPAIPYAWPVLEEWMWRLKERRILTFKSHDARGGFGGIEFTALGQTVIAWIVDEGDVA